jgi:hypothetical protein
MLEEPRSQFYQPIWAMRKDAGIRQMTQMILFCFNNISDKNLLHVFGYGFYIECHIMAHFCKVPLPLKA